MCCFQYVSIAGVYGVAEKDMKSRQGPLLSTRSSLVLNPVTTDNLVGKRQEVGMLATWFYPIQEVSIHNICPEFLMLHREMMVYRLG